MKPPHPSPPAPHRRPLRRTTAEAAGCTPLLGAHVSVAGGMPGAFVRARDLACGAMQVFVKNQQQWRGRDLPDAEVEAFRRAAAASGVRRTMAHASYLANLASPDAALGRRSQAALRDEMRRCARLGVAALVLHPGAHLGSGEAAGLRRVAAGLRALLADPDLAPVEVWIESTAGQGTCLGHRFEHLARLVADAGGSARLGVCLDTCHLLAAGYDLRGAAAYERVFREFESTVGLARLRAFHLNDSRTPLGSRVDRHAGIGAGHLGRDAFARLVADARFVGLPMVLETPGGQEGYRRDLRLLRRLLPASGAAVTSDSGASTATSGPRAAN
jgi:deoxyribonuclease-4